MPGNPQMRSFSQTTLTMRMDKQTDGQTNSSSSDGSDIIVRSESNVITIDVDLSTMESVINVGTQTNVVPYCRCEEAIAAIV